MIILYLCIVIVVGYLLGCINFARIFTWKLAKKDITEVGSKNPGTMNMLRTQGFGRAMLTLCFEAIKVGLPALVCFFVFLHFEETATFAHLAYFLSAFSGILGHCFPVFYKFKGGKGVACTFGMFLFHPLFWLPSIIMFVICFFLFFFIKYGFIISLTFILTMTIYATVTCVVGYSWPIPDIAISWWIPIVVIVWINFIFILIRHKSNIQRLLAGKENKVDFKEKVFKRKKKEKNDNDEVDKNKQIEKNKQSVNIDSAEVLAVEAGEENVKENKKEE